MGGLIGPATSEKDGLTPKGSAISRVYITSYTDYPNRMFKLLLPSEWSGFISISASSVPSELYHIAKSEGEKIVIKALVGTINPYFKVKFKMDSSQNLYISKRYGGGVNAILPLAHNGAYTYIENVDVSSLSLTDIGVI